MNFKFQGQLRLAGSLVALLGLAIHNWAVVIFGWLLVFVGYTLAIAKIEKWIESQEVVEEEDQDALR